MHCQLQKKIQNKTFVKVGCRRHCNFSSQKKKKLHAKQFETAKIKKKKNPKSKPTSANFVRSCFEELNNFEASLPHLLLLHKPTVAYNKIPNCYILVVLQLQPNPSLKNS